MTIDYRLATVSDAAALTLLFRDCFCETFGHLYDPSDLSAFLSQHGTEYWEKQLGNSSFAVRMAEADGTAVGYSKLGPLKLPVDESVEPLELRQLYILKPWQGSGIATVLMDWTLEAARQRDARELYLSVFTENFRARRFYARYGFVEVGPYAFMVGNQADEDIIMKLEL